MCAINKAEIPSKFAITPPGFINNLLFRILIQLLGK